MLPFSKAVVTWAEPPEAPPPVPPTQSGGLLGEWRIPLQIVRLGVAAPRLGGLRAEVAEPVVLIPGWKAPEATMTPLRRYLRWLGHHARHWGLGTNEGRPQRDTRRLLPVVKDLASRSGRSVTLVGWSLGGAIARELAREIPEHVAQVVTYGAPVVGGPSYTIGASQWGEDECARIAALVRARERDRPLRVPVAAIFSRGDRIVSWPACIDRISPDVVHYEVRSSHVGMGLDPDVWSIVAQRLAELRSRGG